MKRISPRILIAIAIVAAIVSLRFSPLGDYLTLDALRTHRDALQHFVTTNPLLSSISYTITYALATALSFPGAVILTLAGGALFGVWWGCVCVNIGATFGATGAFIVARYLLRDTVRARYGSRLAVIDKHIEAQGGYYLFAVRLVPIFPFFLINILAALTPISLMTFVVTTSLGIIPGSLVYLYAGTQLASINAVGDLLSPGMLIAFALLGCLALLPVVFNRFFGRRLS